MKSSIRILADIELNLKVNLGIINAFVILSLPINRHLFWSCLMSIAENCLVVHGAQFPFLQLTAGLHFPASQEVWCGPRWVGSEQWKESRRFLGGTLPGLALLWDPVPSDYSPYCRWMQGIMKRILRPQEMMRPQIRRIWSPSPFVKSSHWIPTLNGWERKEKNLLLCSTIENLKFVRIVSLY